MTSFLYRMPAGIPGAVTRAEHATIEPGLMNSAAPFSAYGLPAKIASGKFVPVGAGDVAAAMVAILVRPYPTQAAQDPLGTATPPQTGGIGDFLKRGYMTAKLNGGATLAKGDQIYIRTANASAGKPIGGFEGAAENNSSQAATSAAVAGNTGNGTMGTITVTAGVPDAGVHKLRITKAATNAGDFEVISPSGALIGVGSVGVAFNAGGLAFTLADGSTDFALGDGFDITVTSKTNTIAPAGLVAMGPADASGNIELAYNI